MAMFSKGKGANPPSAGLPASGSEVSFLGAKLAFIGRVSGGGGLVLMGRFEGEIALDGELTIAPTAVVKARIKAAAVSASGTVEGDITAAGRIHLEKSAAVTGRIQAGRLSIVEGALLNGEVGMVTTHPAERKNAESLEKTA